VPFRLIRAHFHHHDRCSASCERAAFLKCSIPTSPRRRLSMLLRTEFLSYRPKNSSSARQCTRPASIAGLANASKLPSISTKIVTAGALNHFARNCMARFSAATADQKCTNSLARTTAAIGSFFAGTVATLAVAALAQPLAACRCGNFWAVHCEASPAPSG
jgi:hypothetical protein